MSEDEVVIRRGLPQHLRADAARLFDEAFGDMMGMAIPEQARREAFLEVTFRADHIVAALRRDQLAGMVGLSAVRGTYRGGVIEVRGALGQLRKRLGLLAAARAILVLSMAAHKPEEGELYIDGIVVDAAARGLGIGTRLLEEAHDIAREDGFRWVRLDVIDTNTRAQALYERLGYKVTRVQSFRYMSRIVGFGGLASMELALDS